MKPISDLFIREFLLENDTWLPSQVLSTNGSRCLPERSLLFELLAGALHDLDNPVKKYRKRALRWLLSSRYYSPFTCAQVCDYLGLDHQSLKTKVRAGLRLLRSRRDSSIHHAVHPPEETQCNYSPAPESPELNPLKSHGTCILLVTSLKTNETPSGNGSAESEKESPS